MMQLLNHESMRLWLGPCLLIVMAQVAVSAERSRYFREHGGVYRGEHPLPDDFGQGVRRLWRVELPPGNSTPCVYEGSVYVTTFDKVNQQLSVVAIDRESGAIRWQRLVPAETIEPYHPVGSPASTTPACNGRQLFVFFGSYGLLSYDLEGELVWAKRMGPFQDEFGAASSPILVDDLVVLNQDHDRDNFLIAVDQRTGDTVWKTPREGFTRGYSTPAVLDSARGKQIVVAGSLQLAAYEATTGDKLWWVDGISRIVDSSPLVVENSVYVATWTPGGDASERIAMEPFTEALSSYDSNRNGRIEKSELPAESPVVPRFYRIDLNQNQQLDDEEWRKHALVFERAKNVAMRVRPDGLGDLTNSSVEWQFRRGLPTVPSPVVYDGVLYMVKDGGIVTGLAVETGKMLKEGRIRGPGNYYASLVAGDGKVFACSERGVITVLKAARRWEVLSSHDLDERIMATPVINAGKVLIRTDEALYCFVKSGL